MPLSTGQLREAWAPACKDAHGQEIVALWSVIDDVMIAHRYVPRPGYTSAANCRPITGGRLPSIHSFYDRSRHYTFRSSSPGRPVTIPVAAALDVNSDKNPYGPRLVTDMPEAMWRAWLRVRTNSGAQAIVWGGLFTPNHDAMHLQPGCTPADIRSGFDLSTLPNPTPAPTPMEDDMRLLAPEGQNKVWLIIGNVRQHVENTDELDDLKRSCGDVKPISAVDWEKYVLPATATSIVGLRDVPPERRAQLDRIEQNTKP